MTTRLLDLINRNPGRTKNVSLMRAACTHAVPFIVDNVFSYMKSDEKTVYTWSDFPNIAPPFPRYWMEYAGWHPVHGHTQTGSLIIAARYPEDRAQLLSEAREAHSRSDGGDTTGVNEEFFEHLRAYMQKHEALNPRWLLNFVQIERRSESDEPLDDLKHPPLVTCRTQIFVNPDGSRTCEEAAIQVFDQPEGWDINKHGIKLFARNAPFLLATSFLHCKNVSHGEQKAPRAERRRLQRAGIEEPTITYKTLVIEPMTKVLRTEGRSDEHGLKKAMHICRGHFKTFDEKPLFGRHRGMFFWNDQVRNTESNRAVAKRYDVRADKAHGADESAGVLVSAPTGES